jgi:hypothetical protein
MPEDKQNICHILTKHFHFENARQPAAQAPEASEVIS